MSNNGAPSYVQALDCFTNICSNELAYLHRYGMVKNEEDCEDMTGFENIYEGALFSVTGISCNYGYSPY